MEIKGRATLPRLVWETEVGKWSSEMVPRESEMKDPTREISLLCGFPVRVRLESPCIILYSARKGTAICRSRAKKHLGNTLLLENQ